MLNDQIIDKMGGVCSMPYVLRRSELHRGFWWRNLSEKDYLEKLSVGEDNSKTYHREI